MMKFRKSLLLLTACASALLVTSCGDNVVEASRNQTSAPLNVVVRDAATNDVPPGTITVELLTTGQKPSAWDAATGTAKFYDVPVGTHMVRVTDPDTQYVGVLEEKKITLEHVSGYNSTTVGQEATLEVFIHKRDASLSGQVYYKNKEGISTVAEKGATIRVVLDETKYVERIFEGTVGDSGKYKVSNLPAVGTDYEVWALGQEFGTGSDKRMYRTTKMQGGVPPLKANHVALMSEAGMYDLDEAQFGFVIVERPTTINPIDTAAPIVFKFSRNIDLSSVSPSIVNVTALGKAPVPPFHVAWDNLTLTITPFKAWRGDITVEITADIKSEAGGVIKKDKYNVGVILRDLTNDVVVGLKRITNKDSINVKSTDVGLVWNSLPGADDYEVFVRRVGSTNRVFQSVGTSSDTTGRFSFSHVAAESEIGDSSYVFVVRARNDRSITKLEGAELDTAIRAFLVLSTDESTRVRSGLDAASTWGSTNSGSENKRSDGTFSLLSGKNSSSLFNTQYGFYDQLIVLDGETPAAQKMRVEIEFNEAIALTTPGVVGSEFKALSPSTIGTINRFRVTNVQITSGQNGNDTKLSFVVEVAKGPLVSTGGNSIDVSVTITGVVAKSKNVDGTNRTLQIGYEDKDRNWFTVGEKIEFTMPVGPTI